MKILKTLYTATLCAAMAVSTSSCLNSWLDQSPADGIDAETAIKNSDDFVNDNGRINVAHPDCFKNIFRQASVEKGIL